MTVFLKINDMLTLHEYVVKNIELTLSNSNIGMDYKKVTSKSKFTVLELCNPEEKNKRPFLILSFGNSLFDIFPEDVSSYLSGLSVDVPTPGDLYKLSEAGINVLSEEDQDDGRNAIIYYPTIRQDNNFFTGIMSVCDERGQGECDYNFDMDLVLPLHLH